ncbi:hypothetical protein M758_12G051000 [Ceratodon purpureus]|nr:hypothetical protein M758_12G051000 [Ceratodon purpureus]
MTQSSPPFDLASPSPASSPPVINPNFLHQTKLHYVQNLISISPIPTQIADIYSRQTVPMAQFQTRRTRNSFHQLIFQTQNTATIPQLDATLTISSFLSASAKPQQTRITQRFKTLSLFISPKAATFTTAYTKRLFLSVRKTSTTQVKFSPCS